MGEPARRLATYSDLFDLPEHVLGEIIDGELFVSPRPGPLHTRTASHVGARLQISYGDGEGGPDDPGGWRILDEPELHLGDQIVVPDIAGWRVERMPRPPTKPYFTVSPDWTCEILSPSTARIDRSRKMRIYARHRVGYLWMIDPELQTLEAFRLTGEFWVQIIVLSGRDKGCIPPFEELELDLSRWWWEPEETPDLPQIESSEG